MNEIDNTSLLAHIDRVIAGLNEAEDAQHRARWSTEPDKWHAVHRQKFSALDCGSSGAFLVERATGELFNISAYGRADRNKKRKADLGNIATVEPKWLHGKRWNYLR